MDSLTPANIDDCFETDALFAFNSYWGALELLGEVINFVDEKNKDLVINEKKYYNNECDSNQTDFEFLFNQRLLTIRARTDEEANILLIVARVVIDKNLYPFMDMIESLLDELKIKTDSEEDYSFDRQTLISHMIKEQDFHTSNDETPADKNEHTDQHIKKIYENINIEKLTKTGLLTITNLKMALEKLSDTDFH